MRTEQAIREFLASRVTANLSAATISWYEDRLLPFARSCPTRPRRPEPIECFLATVQGSPETKFDVYRALKTLFRLISSRHRFPNPHGRDQATVSPQGTHGDPGARRVDETCFISAENQRDRAILTLMMDSGVRAGEVCSLLKHNIKRETVIVHGKTGWSEVPISDETRRLFLQIAAMSPDDHVFCGHKGPKMGLPHHIRHAFGKNYLVKGGDLRSLQEIMGHADVKTTEKYSTLNLNGHH